MPFSRDVLLSDALPLEDHIGDQVCLVRDGSVFAMFEVEGVAWETAEAADLLSLHARLNLTLRNVATDRLRLTTWTCRGLASPGDYPAGKFRSAFSEAVDLVYRERLYDASMYANRIFLGVQIMPPRIGNDWSTRKFAKWRGPAKEAPEARVEKLEHACKLLAAELRKYQPHRLGLEVRGEVVYSQMAEALAYAMTGEWRPVPLSTGRLGNAILSEEIIVGSEVIEVRAPGGSSFVAMFGMREFPASTSRLGMFHRFLAAPYRFTLTQSFRCFSKGDAHSILTRKQNLMVKAGDKAFEQTAALTQAANDVQDKFVMGEYGLALAVFAKRPSAFEQLASDAWRDLADSGCITARETKALQGSFFSQVPGNAHWQPRSGAISSRNFAAMSPFHNYPTGQKKGHWGGPIALFRTMGGTPYAFHLHVRDVGNTFVSGRVGSGKTTWLAFIISQLEKAGSQVVLFDKDRGLEIFTRAIGGRYLPLDEPTWINPIKGFANTPRNRTFIADLIRSCIRADGGAELTAEEDRRLGLAVSTVMPLPVNLRSLSEIRAFMGVGGAGERLEKWCWGREYGWVIDCPEHRITLDSAVIGFDQTKILENKMVRGPVIATLFHQIDDLLDGRRVVIVIDELWRSLLDPVFVPLVNNGIKTFRKRGAPMILATQSLTDALDSPIGHTIREQCPTLVAFANPNGNEDDYERFGYSRAESQIIKTLPEGNGSFLLKQGEQSLVAQIPFAGMDWEISIMSGREETVRLLDTMPDDVKTDPARLLAEFGRAVKEIA